MKNLKKISWLGFIALAFLTACNNSKTGDSNEKTAAPSAAGRCGDMDRSCTSH